MDSNTDEKELEKDVCVIGQFQCDILEKFAKKATLVKSNNENTVTKVDEEVSNSVFLNSFKQQPT